jgi:protein-L-isoaspartate(D-aspartate) O-methyltransferase
VLAAMRKIPRHRFVPRGERDEAYQDYPLPIGKGQTISQPYIVGLMSELLRLTGKEKVLEIGTGCGYQAAVLAEIAKEVYTIEIVPELARQAEKTLKELGYSNIHVRTGNGYGGWPEEAPFDAVIVTAAPEHIPQMLVDQLKRGGRIVIPVGLVEQDLIRGVKTEKGLATETIIPVRFVPLVGKEKK